MPKKSQPHDHFFKAFIQERSLAISFLNIHLPPELVKLIDFSTLTLINSELLPSAIRKLQSDAVFRCTIKQGEDYLYLIIEHQSTAKRLMPLRIHEYTTALMRYHLKQGHTKLPLIWPLVLYHGLETPYPYSRQIWDLFKNPTHAQKMLSQGHQLVDVSVMTDQEIASHGVVALLEWPLRDAFNQGEHFLDKAKSQLRLLLDSNQLEQCPDFKFGLLRYIIGTYKGEKSPEMVINELIQTVPEEKEAMLTAGQQLEQRGMQQGLQQGLQQGEHKKSLEIAQRLLEKGMSVDEIIQITGLAKKELRQRH